MAAVVHGIAWSLSVLLSESGTGRKCVVSSSYVYAHRETICSHAAMPSGQLCDWASPPRPVSHVLVSVRRLGAAVLTFLLGQGFGTRWTQVGRVIGSIHWEPLVLPCHSKPLLPNWPDHYRHTVQGGPQRFY